MIGVRVRFRPLRHLRHRDRLHFALLTCSPRHGSLALLQNARTSALYRVEVVAGRSWSVSLRLASLRILFRRGNLFLALPLEGIPVLIRRSSRTPSSAFTKYVSSRHTA